MFQAILVILIVLGMITLIGHGMWVLLAKLIRLATRHRAPPPFPAGPIPIVNQCPRCQAPLIINQTCCPICQYSLPESAIRPDAALQAILDQLVQYEQRGVLARDVAAPLIARLDTERIRLQASGREPAPPPPIPVPPAPRLPVASDTAPAATGPAPTVPPAAPPTGPPAEPRPEAAAPPPTARDVADQTAVRAQRYATQRARADAEERAEDQPTTRPAPRLRKPLATLFATFMEEKNIRWGELIGGMLIICGSIALVMSFWSQIAERPFLKFFLFNGVTAALFGIGFYSHKRWKLETTSRGILITGTLLVPLNFLAIAAFTTAADMGSVASLGLISGELLSIGLFTALALFAARILIPATPWFLTLGVIVPSVLQLLIRRWIDPLAGPPILYLFAAAPILGYLAVIGCYLNKIRHVDPLDERAANAIFILFGICSYALLIAFGLLLFKTESISQTMHWLAPMITLIGVPGIATGLFFWQRVTDPDLAGIRTSGLSIGILGALILIGATHLAWPDPLTLFLVALIDAIVFTVIALLFKIPSAHLVAGLAFAVAWLVGFHAFAGSVPWHGATPQSMLHALVSPKSGTALVPLTALFGGISLFWHRLRRREEVVMHGMVAAVVAAMSLGLVTWFGFRVPGDPFHVAWIYMFHAAAALTAAWLTNHRILGWTASVLLLFAIVQTVVYGLEGKALWVDPWAFAFMTHATIAAIATGIVRWFSLRRISIGHETGLGEPFTWSTMATSIAGLVLIALGMFGVSDIWTVAAISRYVFWLAAVWLILAFLNDWPDLFAAFQVLVYVAMTYGIATMVADRTWYTTARWPWLDPWFIVAAGTAGALYCLLWTLIRIGLRTLGHPPATTDPTSAPHISIGLADRFLNLSRRSVDDRLAMGLVIVLILLTSYAAIPGTAQELTPRTAPALAGSESARHVPPATEFALPSLPHRHAAGTGTWLFAASVGLMFIAGMWEQATPWRWLGLFGAAFSVCPLLAARWEPSVATASALRWILAGFFLIGSVPIWHRRRIAGWAARIGWQPSPPASGGHRPSMSAMIRPALLASQGIPLLAMAIYVMVAAICLAGFAAPIADRFWLIYPVLLIATVGALAVRFWPVAEPQSKAGNRDVPIGKEASIEPAAMRRYGRLLFDTILLIGLGSYLAALFFTVAAALKGHPVTGPEPNTWFHEIGWAVSYVVPMGIIALILVGHAIRERSDGYAFSAGLLFNLSATVAYAFTLSGTGGLTDGTAWIQLAQLNTIVAAVVAILWYAALVWSTRHRFGSAAEPAPPGEERVPDDPGTPPAHPPGAEGRADPLQAGLVASSSRLLPVLPPLFGTQVAFALALSAVSILPATFWFVMEPDPVPWIEEAARWNGWLGLLLTLGVVAGTWRRLGSGVLETFVGMALVLLGPMAAITADRWDVAGNWLGYHVLLVAWAAAAWLLLGMGLWRIRRYRGIGSVGNRGDAARWSMTFGLATIVLAFRALGADPGTPWWTIGALLAMSGLGAALTARTGRRVHTYMAGLLFNIAISLWWLDSMRSRGGFEVLLETLLIEIIALAGPVIGWILLDRRFVAARHGPDTVPRGIGFHRVAGSTSVVLMIGTTFLSLAAHWAGWPSSANPYLGWAALIVAGTAVIACLWDAATRFAVAHLYLLGLAASGWLLDNLRLEGDLFDWSLTLILAAYTLATSYLWSRRVGLWEWAARFGAPVRTAAPAGPSDMGREPSMAPIRPGFAWMVPANLLLAILVTISALQIDLTFPDWKQRMLASYAILAQAFAIGLLARGVVRSSLQYTALLFGVFGGIAFGFAWLPIDIVAPWLHRTVVIAVSLSALIVFYGFGLVKLIRRENEWTRAAARLVPLLAGLAGLALLVVLGLETAQFITTQSSLALWPAIVAVAIAVAGLALAALAAAVLPGRDPLGLSERGKQAYVYAAEVLLGLLFLHIRVTMPFLFRGWFVQFWPILVMLIAFVGVGLSEWFRRHRQQILSEPLERTGALLPLLPVVGYWVVPNASDYSIVLLAVGALYSALASLRKSFLFAILAALAANGSLWYLLYRADGLGLAEHPQLWLIPPALCVLAASYVNRRQLSAPQMITIRYLASIVIYASSTADVFLIGVAEAPWLPWVLAGISLAGIVTGIALRIRAFLYLGTAFLLVALFTFVWYAAVDLDQTWIWWVTTIITGAVMITVFAIFEKKRDNILRMVDELKKWDA